MRYLNATSFAITFIPSGSGRWKAMQPRAGIGPGTELPSAIYYRISATPDYIINGYWPEASIGMTGILDHPSSPDILESNTCRTEFSRAAADKYANLSDLIQVWCNEIP